MTFLQDLRYAVRSLRKRPGFVIVAVATLALGIGFNTGIFTLFNAFALRPLPVKDPSRVVNVYRKMTRGQMGIVLSYPDYADLRDRNQSLSGLAAYAPAPSLMSGAGGRSESVLSYVASGNYFPVLGANFALGRPFSPEEDAKAGAAPFAVLSNAYWKSRFAADPGVLGRTLVLNGTAFTVIGVTAPDFTGPALEIPDLWVPLAMADVARPGGDLLHERQSGWLHLVGRLKPGASVAAAQSDLSVIGKQLDDEYGKGGERRYESMLVTPGSYFGPHVKRLVTPIAILLFAAVSLVLLIACANVANLMLARGASRQKELGIRIAIGASRGRILRQLLTESLVIAVLGAAAALLFSSELPRLVLNALQPLLGRPIPVNIAPDARVLSYTLLLAVGTAAAFGLLPALQASRPECIAALKDEGSNVARRLSRSRLRSLLVVGQVAVSLVLLIAAGLLLRALGRAQSTDPGFDIHHAVVASLNLRAQGYDQPRAERLERQAAEQLKGMSDVRSVAFALIAPLSGGTRSDEVATAETASFDKRRLPNIDANPVSWSYFETLGLPLVAGRAFTEQEQQLNSPVAVVNQSAARLLFAGKNPVGQRLRMSDDVWREVVGVMQDARLDELWDAGTPYICYPQGPRDRLGALMLVRTDGDPRTLAQTVAAGLQGVAPGLQANVQPMETYIEQWLIPSRIGAWLASALGALALVLAATGIYGLMSHAVTQRTREIGIRMALGAPRGQVLSLVLRQGMALVALGGAAGLAGSILSTRVLSRFLYGMSTVDPLTFGAVVLFLACVAALACYIPARRASRVDPMVALRTE